MFDGGVEFAVADQRYLAGEADFGHLARDDRRRVGEAVHDDGLRAGIADLRENAAEIDFAFLVVVFGQDLALELGQILLRELDGGTAIVAVDRENGELREAPLLGGVFATIRARFSSVG